MRCQQCFTLHAQSDDRVVKEEGLDNLTDDELRSACRARGMRTPYGEGAVLFMRKQLQEWLDLSLNRSVVHIEAACVVDRLCCLQACTDKHRASRRDFKSAHAAAF